MFDALKTIVQRLAAVFIGLTTSSARLKMMSVASVPCVNAPGTGTSARPAPRLSPAHAHPTIAKLNPSFQIFVIFRTLSPSNSIMYA